MNQSIFWRWFSFFRNLDCFLWLKWNIVSNIFHPFILKQIENLVNCWPKKLHQNLISCFYSVSENFIICFNDLLLLLWFLDLVHCSLLFVFIVSFKVICDNIEVLLIELYLNIQWKKSKKINNNKNFEKFVVLIFNRITTLFFSQQ